MGKGSPFGEEYITYETVCSRGHHLKFTFAKKILKGKLDKGEVQFSATTATEFGWLRLSRK
jgi:hypothetical protein